MDVYEEMFGGFQSSALRIETLPNYHIEGEEWEEFGQYRQGLPIEGFANQDWLEDLERWRTLHKEIKRIRVVPYRLTEYLRYEFEWCYPRNWLAGEVIMVVGQGTYDQFVAPETKEDFWIFDKKYVLKMKYDEEGHYLGEKLLSEPQLVDPHVTLFTKLEERAVPYTDIVKQLRQATVKVAAP